MPGAGFVALVAVLVPVVAVVLRAVAAYFKFRGRRVITCPVTRRPAAVRVDAAHAALTAAFVRPVLRLADCSRWPEGRHCGQTCIDAIESAPEDSLVRTLLARWYEGRSCVLCGWRFGPLDGLDRQPAFLSPDHGTLEWSEVPAERLPEVLTTHHPICRNCHIIEALRRDHPELIVDPQPAGGAPQASPVPGTRGAP